MTIATLDNYIGSAKQRVTLSKTTTRTTVATGWFSMFDIAGNPGAGTLAGTSTANGVVPTDATAGTPSLNAFSGSNGNDTVSAAGDSGAPAEQPSTGGGSGFDWKRIRRNEPRLPTAEEIHAERVRLGILPADAVAETQPEPAAPAKPVAKPAKRPVTATQFQLDAAAIVAANQAIRDAIESAARDELSRLLWESVQQDEAAMVALIAELV